jgi:hypothetical protein
MSEQAGRKASISIVGNVILMSNIEVCQDVSVLQDGTKWQVSDITRRILDKVNTLSVFQVLNTNTCITGTTTNSIKIINHGLVTGDGIVNNTRTNAWRLITKVDNDTFTVTSIAGQVIGDLIVLYKKISPIKINYVSGTITIASGSTNAVSVLGGYLPKTLIATANDYSYNQSTDMGDVTSFLATHKKRMPLLKYTSGTLSYWDITDSYFTDALLADTPKYVVLEDGISQKALLAYFDKTELKANIGNPQSMTVGFFNANEEC